MEERYWEMRTLNEEIARIKSEVADIASKVFTGQTIQERVEQHFSEITSQEYEASKIILNDLSRKCKELTRELFFISNQITAIEKKLCLSQ